MNKLILSVLALCISLQIAATTNPEVSNNYSWSEDSRTCRTGDSAMMASWAAYLSTLDVHQVSGTTPAEEQGDFFGNLPKIVKSVRFQINNSSCKVYIHNLMEVNDLDKVKMICNTTLAYLKQITEEILPNFNSKSEPATQNNSASRKSLRKYLNNNEYYC